MIVYLDKDYKCHLNNNDDIIMSIETDYFSKKSDQFIEGFRFVPEGEKWTREDGTVFYGEMIVPWKPFDEIDQVQREYEQELAEAALILLGGS